MQVQGVTGTATAQGLQGYIELQSFDFSAARKMSTKPGVASDREGGKPVISEITVTKFVDQTTPVFFGKATVGQTEAQPVTIKFVNTGANLSEYLTVTLTGVMVSGQKIVEAAPVLTEDGNIAQEKPTEELTLNFTKIEFKATPYDANHKAGAPVSHGYDLVAAQAA